MSLRLRIVAVIALVLAIGSGLGLALAGWQARQRLKADLENAQQSAELVVARAFSDLPRAADPDRELDALIATFDGDRRLKARLLGADGREISASWPGASKPAPAWFAALLRDDVAPLQLAAPGASGKVVELDPVYANDTAAVWPEFLDLGLVLALACAAGAGAVALVVERALAPLRTIGQVLPRIGAGDYGVRAPTTGPPELVALGRGVNEMAARLRAMRERNRALEEQVLTLQDEERADIARDLHDEIGPHLFAANVDAAMTASLISAGKPQEALAQVRAISASIAHMQRLVRDILARLRPTRLAELGLSSAVADLLEFWRARRPETTFESRLPGDDEPLPEPVREILYRIVQESLSNAIRHADPQHVAVTIERHGDEARVEVRNDGAAAGSGTTPGYGLTGMAERVAAIGGVLTTGPTPDGGWRVAARLPLSAAAMAPAQ